MAEADFFGTASSNKMADKFTRSGLHAVKSHHVDAPIIEEFAIAVECKLEKRIPSVEDIQTRIGSEGKIS